MYSELFDNEEKDNMFEISPPEDVTHVEKLDDDSNKVVIVDDIKLDNKNIDNIKDYFSLSRYKNCNCIYLTQSYYDV